MENNILENLGEISKDNYLENIENSPNQSPEKKSE